MAAYETFTHKGKDYKFRVGRETPEVKPLIKYGSEYYKGKQKSLSWAIWLSFVPLVVLGVIYFAYIGSEDQREGLQWLAILAFPYGMLLYAIHDRIADADKVLVDLQKHAEDEEYLEAYRAWMKTRGE